MVYFWLLTPRVYLRWIFSLQASHSFAIREGKLSSEPAAAEKQRKLAAMYAPPTDIMFVGDFQAARQVCCGHNQLVWWVVDIVGLEGN